MSAPIVYRWDDGNAPVARGERRSLCDILTACLVTGYGTKPAAGWTLEYINATFDKAAFRNNPATGTGFFLQVDGAGGANAYTPKVQAYEVMTSESAGLFPFNATVQFILISDSANTTARPWVLIADDRAFYFTCWNSITAAPTNATGIASGVYFGDLIARIPSDAYACGLLASQYGYPSPMMSAAATLGSSYDIRLPRKSSGAVGTSYVGSTIGNGGPIGSFSGGAGMGLPYTIGDPILISRPYINDGAAYTVRGFLPGFYCPCHPMAFSQLVQVSAEDMTFLSHRGYGAGGNACNWFISLNDWRS